MPRRRNFGRSQIEDAWLGREEHMDWHEEQREREHQKMQSAAALAGNDPLFISLLEAYMASSPEDRDIVALMRDRLLDLGVEDEIAKEYANEQRWKHNDNEIPF